MSNYSAHQFRTMMAVFDHKDFQELSLREINLLASDIKEVMQDSLMIHTFETAARILRDRIGGSSNLKSYCQSLAAQPR
jgi:hypothetical protein